MNAYAPEHSTPIDLTWNQGRALRNLAESKTAKTARNLSEPIDFHGPWLSIAAARAAANALVRKGLAEVAATTTGPTRYTLTEAGWSLAKERESVNDL